MVPTSPWSAPQFSSPHRPFFASAAALAALAVPAWALTYAGMAPIQLPAWWHGHEMVFGYGLAVVAGFLITRCSPAAGAAAYAVWVAGRVAPLMGATGTVVGAVVALAFPVALFLLAGRRFAKAARSGDNLLFAPLIAAFTIGEAVFQSGALGIVAGAEWRGLLLGINLLDLLMFAMGGRIIAAAASGALQRQGLHLHGLATARLERLGVLALVGVIVGDLWSVLWPASAVFSLAAAVIIALRLRRWRPWRMTGAADVLALQVGYAWLAVGLVVKAAAAVSPWFAPGLAVTDAIHVLTIGALGTLTATMMVRTALQRHRRPVRLSPPACVALGLISLAVPLRLLAVVPEVRVDAILTSATAWGAGFVIVCLLIVTMTPAPAMKRTMQRPQKRPGRQRKPAARSEET